MEISMCTKKSDYFSKYLVRSEFRNLSNIYDFHCVKSVHIRRFSGPYFPAFGLNVNRYRLSLRIQSEYGKIKTRKTPNTETFHKLFVPKIVNN